MSRERNKFEKLVLKFSVDLYRYAYWMCKDKPLAEDLVQETFYRAWKSFNHLRDISVAKAWLITILRREYARVYAQKRIISVDVELVKSELTAEEDPHRQAECTELHAAIMALETQFREPLALQIGVGLSGEEIAEQLGVNLNTVNMRLYRARQQLREHYLNARRSHKLIRAVS